MVPWGTCTFTVAEYDHVYMNSTDLYFTRVSPANIQVNTSKHLIKNGLYILYSRDYNTLWLSDLKRDFILLLNQSSSANTSQNRTYDKSVGSRVSASNTYLVHVHSNRCKEHSVYTCITHSVIGKGLTYPLWREINLKPSHIIFSKGHTCTKMRKLFVLWLQFNYFKKGTYAKKFSMGQHLFETTKEMLQNISFSFRQTQKQRFKTNAGSHILYTINSPCFDWFHFTSTIYVNKNWPSSKTSWVDFLC